MRRFLISLLLAFIFLLPVLGEEMDWRIPLQGLISIPATGLGYMLVFFHELGHTATRWLFGQPAIPSFDFAFGGGLTQSYGRSWLLLGIIWLGMAAGAVWLWREMYYRALIALIVVAALHVLCVFTNGYDMVSVFMGHGGEILVAGICLLRAFWNTTEKSRGKAERWLNMIFGLFVLGHNLIMTAGLMLSDISRSAYSMQKGGHLLGDLEKLAVATQTSVRASATFLCLFTLVVAIIVIYMGFKHAPDEDRVQKTFAGKQKLRTPPPQA
jgi:hypothetical protein